jgi:hypothetical protein
MNYSSRFFLYAPLGLFLSLALGVGIHWWVVASAFSDRLAAWNGHEIVPGVTIRYASRNISGFPFSLDTVFQDVSLRIETPRGATEWHSEHFAMHALTYGRAETIFEAAGRQELRWTGNDGRGRSLTFAVGSLHASAIQDKGGLTRFDLDLVGFGSQAMTARRLQFHIRRTRRFSTFDIFAAVNDVRFPLTDRPSLGEHITEGHLAGTFTPDRGIDRLWTGDQYWFEAAEIWHENRGRFYINELTLVWNELALSGKGSVVLDNAHRPDGLIQFEVSGLEKFRLRAADFRIPRGPNAGLASALLDRSDGADRVTTDLRFANGIVFVGGEPADTVTKLY